MNINKRILGFILLCGGLYSIYDAYKNPTEKDILLLDFGRYFFGVGSIIFGFLFLFGIIDD
jgi:hypothetical protein